ncbi:benzoate/H(+) symporter BenE family transporter [Pseudokineococcus marinus]
MTHPRPSGRGSGERPRGDLAQAVGAGVVAAVTGFASTSAVVLAGLAGAGATPAQAASGLLAVAVVSGLVGAALSARTRMPLSVAWSTPGAALLATSGRDDFPAAVGAFCLAGLLVVLCGLVRPLGRALTSIPAPLAAAMLAGILLPLCLAPARAAAQTPLLALPVLAVWLALVVLAPRWAVPAALLAAVAVVLATGGLGALGEAPLAPAVEVVAPRLDAGALLGIGLPLFVVTMAGQDIPGLAILRHHGYAPPARAALVSTGLASAAAAPLGAHAVNLGAVTAALTAGPDAGPDPARRWRASVANGAALVLLGLSAPAVTAVVTASPGLLVEAVAGLALLGSLGGALRTAVAGREGDGQALLAPLVVLAVSASGVTVAGVGSAFWGLLVGLGLHLLLRRRGGAPDGVGEEPDGR